MRGNRKNWAEGFTLGLLVGIVAAVSYLAARPVPAGRRVSHLRGTPPVRLTARGPDSSYAMLMADSPSPSVH